MTGDIYETARMIRETAAGMLEEAGDDLEDSATVCLLKAIRETEVTDVDACFHTGMALLYLPHGLSDPPYRIGGALCDPRIAAIANCLHWQA